MTGEGKSVNKVWLRQRLHAAIVRGIELQARSQIFGALPHVPLRSCSHSHRSLTHGEGGEGSRGGGGAKKLPHQPEESTRGLGGTELIVVPPAGD